MFFPSRAQIILSFVHTWHSGTWHGLQVYLTRKHAALTSRRIFFESMGRMKDFDIRNPMPQKAWEFFEVWMSLSLHLTKKNEIKKVDESSRPFSRFQNLMDFTGKSSRCQKKHMFPPCFLGGTKWNKSQATTRRMSFQLDIQVHSPTRHKPGNVRCRWFFAFFLDSKNDLVEHFS